MTDNNVKGMLKNPFVLDEEEKRKLKTEEVTEIVIEVGKASEIPEKVVHNIPIESVFERYKDIAVISTEIAKALNKNAYNDADISNLSYKDIRDKGLTFFMSDTGFKRTGLLSLCPALLTGIKLYDEMPESKDRKNLLSKLKAGIDAFFKFIYRDDDWKNNSGLKPVFDASPYESDAFYPGDDKEGLDGRSYIDSISWATFLFLKIMSFIDKNDKDKFVFEEYRETAKKLAKWCLSYVNKAVLTIEAEDDESEESDKSYQRPVGWSFSKIVPSAQADPKAQRSLYFTYAAASMYLAFYNEYRDIIDDLMTLNRKDDELNKKGDDDNAVKKIFPLKSNYHENNFKQAEEAIDAFESNMDKEKPDHIKALKDLKEALKRLKEVDEAKLEEYFFFNDGKSAEYNGKIYTVKAIKDKELGAVSQFKWNLEKISNDLWIEAKRGDKLENNFVYDDFNFNIATEEAIKSGGQTNALFAGLLHISICLYSTYDLVISYTKDDGTKRFGPKAYEDMQNTMLLHVQRVQRFFDELEDEGKAFGVDSLTLRFSEDYSGESDKKGNLTDRELAERLRKQSIHITSLTPMLLKTNNLISNYIIKFPQKQMGASLIRIGKKRFYDRKATSNDENEKYSWFWDSDGYHAMSNYYYVGAIFDFYTYYNKYERHYIESYTKLRQRLKRDLEFTDSVRNYYQKKKDEITDEKTRFFEDYEQKLREKNTEIKALHEEVNRRNIGTALVDDINQMIETSQYFDNPEFYKKIIAGIRRQLAQELKTRYEKIPDVDHADLEKLASPSGPKEETVFYYLQALAADIILTSAIEPERNGAMIKNIGKQPMQGEEGVSITELALSGGRQLINDGLIDKIFWYICKNIDLRPNKQIEE
jgi:hypothetical protein